MAATKFTMGFLFFFVTEFLLEVVLAAVIGTVIGIDLGTSYSSVGVYNFKEGADIIANDQGNRITPSWVAFTDTERLIGEAAKNQAALNPERTIFGVKRLIGRKFDDPEVQRYIKYLPYKVINKDEKPYIQVKIKEGMIKVFSPEEISAMILRKMKEMAEAYLGEKITYAIISVPAYFSHAQRQATKDAGVIAGFNATHLINEPSAAAIACGLNKFFGVKKILVYDLGGGTFDASILIGKGGAFLVEATNGDTHLGGEDFDHRVMDYFIKLIKKNYNKDISKDKKALGKLRRECEHVKRALSNQYQVQIEIESLFDGVDFSESLTRALFEKLNMDLFKMTMGSVKKALHDARWKKTDIEEIVLVGGSTRIPKVQELLKNYFNGKEPNQGANPEEAVAYGAAIWGAMLGHQSQGIILLDATTHSLGVGSVHSLGVGTVDGVMTQLIPRNTLIKTLIETKQSWIFPIYNQQTSALITVYEGESNLTKDCRELGRFDVSVPPPAQGGEPEIEVNFNVDFDGILHVSVKDKTENKSESITIMTEKGRLGQEEIERMVKEAEEYAEKDRKMKERIDARNKLETYIYSMMSTITEKIKSSSKEALEWWETYIYSLKSTKEKMKCALEALEWLNENRDAEKDYFDEKMKEVEAVCNPIIEQVYEKSGGGSSGSEDEELYDEL